ncbi:MAG: aminotransferase class V-fold PLP-dependent enzyme, partial [Gemmatimonadetes bacterium]|nr:aminotransferase class V-fold PLP-dependent enzyme [Gemmatimonadota bacterium]
MSDPLLRWRSEFPILAGKTYLNSCSLGALSRRAEAYLDDFRARWHTMGASAWYGPWLERIEDLRGRSARFLGADAEEMALLPSTSAALSVVAESLDYCARPRVVTTELDFPTVAYQWAVKPDVEVVVLRSDDGVTVPVERFAEAVDERTAALATSHVFFTTGAVQDVAALGRIARDAGAVSIIDGYQAAGQIPVDVHALGVDVYTAGPLKWLCGGPGLAYLYVRGALVHELRPRITSWFATEGQFDFDPEGFRSQIAAEVEFDPIAAGLSEHEVRRQDRYIQFATAAAIEAWADAGVEEHEIDRYRMGVTLGSAVGGTMVLENGYVAV